MSESTNIFVSSHGILKSCDWYNSQPSLDTLRSYSYPPVLYVSNNKIRSFRVETLPQIDFSFVLVSGDCDETVPYDIFSSEEELRLFLNHSFLLHWFCQNLVLDHNKMTRMPIGLDYHTMTTKTIWGNLISSYDQEICLQSIKQSSRPFWDRQHTAYGNFHFLTTTRYGYDRKDAIQNLNSSLVFYEPTRITRENTWKRQIDYAFVISPHGNGYDCHRLWEALVLGCIPIVKTSPIDSLYDGLPVLIVKQWSDVTQILLDTTIEQFRHKSFQYEKLTLSFWMDKIRS